MPRSGHARAAGHRGARSALGHGPPHAGRPEGASRHSSRNSVRQGPSPPSPKIVTGRLFHLFGMQLDERWPRRLRRHANLPIAVSMEAGQTQGGDTPTEGRMERGWRLTKAAWALIRRDPTMISIALMGAGCGLAGAA